MLLWILSSSLALGLTLASAYPLKNIYILYLASLATIVITVVSFIIAQRAPDRFLELEVALRRAYRNSRLEGVDLDKLQIDLQAAMQEDHCYLIDNLSLKNLADRLGIKPYQLSEYLNQHRQMNFSRYVNGYRVEAAARILLEEEAANILSVAFQVGFNSKANFNLAFKSIKGCSPREFLRQQRMASKPANQSRFYQASKKLSQVASLIQRIRKTKSDP